MATNQNTLIMSVYEVIAHHYYELKDIAIRETKKFSGNDLDEDIFHSGILRMAETLSNINMTLKQAKGYWCNLYKNALLRSCLYARVKYRDKGEFNASLFVTKDGELDDTIDYESIMSDVESKYNEDYPLFVDFIEGYTLRELNEKYNVPNSDYRVRRIKNYIRRTYPEIQIKRKVSKISTK